MTEFKLSEKRKELLKSILLGSGSRFVKNAVKGIFETIDEQDKEFIRKLKEDAKTEWINNCYECEGTFNEKSFLFSLNKLSGLNEEDLKNE